MRKVQAVLFDLDGVLVPTTVLHRKAWKDLFDSVLSDGVAPYTDDDYFSYVDGKPRYDGVASVLSSRGMTLDWGDPSDPCERNTVCGLGNRKNMLFERLLQSKGIEPYRDTVDVLRHYIAQGARLAVVSSSRNAREVLARAGIIRYFDEVVDGVVRSREGLRGKPAPDTFLYAAQLLHAQLDETAVFEDAVSGIAAARAGGFALVVGVNRGVGRRALMDAGADVVVDNLIDIVDGNGSDVRRRLSATTDPLPEDRYPIDDWRFIERNVISDVSGTLFSVSNGTIGIRGAGMRPRDLGNGTFLSGFQENSKIVYPEDSYGLARVGQMIQGVPDACDFHLSLDGRPLSSYLKDSTQEIDFRSGVSTFMQDYELGPNRLLTVVIRRMACLFDPHLAVIVLHVTNSGLEGSRLEINGCLNVRKAGRDPEASADPRKSDDSESRLNRILRSDVMASDRRSTSRTTQPLSGLVESDVVDVYRCELSQLIMAVGIRQYVNGLRTRSTRWSFMLHDTDEIRVVRYAAYYAYPLEPVGVDDVLRTRTRSEQDPGKLAVACARILDSYASPDCYWLMKRQRNWLTRFWKRSDVKVRLASHRRSRLQQVLRWELFQLAQTTASIPNGISAKGLSGTGYGGHYFWDTEMYVLPFLVFSDPDRARDVLDYRFRMLPAARRRAATMNLDGALFPWRTINGEEASAYFPAGTAQFHIDADVAYAVLQYVSVTGDEDFLIREGIDILVETARIWASIGFFDDVNAYHIHCVTGPDEYSALVNDNFYTNIMAQHNLRSAYDVVSTLESTHPEEFAVVRERLHLERSETECWRRCADAMYLPYDGKRGIHLQDEDFLKRQPWDFARFTARPLLLHYHSLSIYRRQVIKQPDVIMGVTLFGDRFSDEQKKADFCYYDPLTTGDSTLSAAVQCIAASDIGDMSLASRYFHDALFVDVANAHGNTSDGVHLACAGGVWMALVRGFAGMVVHDGKAAFHPHLPDDWDELSFTVLVRGRRMRVTVTRSGVDVKEIARRGHARLASTT